MRIELVGHRSAAQRGWWMRWKPWQQALIGFFRNHNWPESKTFKLVLQVRSEQRRDRVGRVAGLELTMDVLREAFETNVFGVFRVTKAVLPLLKKSTRGRIVNLTSGNGSLGFFTDSKHPSS